MKNLIRVMLLLVIGISVFMVTSCSKTTEPNFEEPMISSALWDYDNVVWFDLDYEEPTKGIAHVYIWMSAKGENPNTTLKIGTQTISFDYVNSYTDGKVYGGGEYSLNTDQPVTYEINNGGKTYTGSVSILPKKVEVSTWPDFNPSNNYSVNWSIAKDPQLNVIAAYFAGNNKVEEYARQILGTQKNYTLLQSTWAQYAPLNYFEFGINSIGYERLNKKKVLIAGVSSAWTWWDSNPEKGSKTPKAQPFRFFDQVIEDIAK